jgi:tetratricopeptide (TPR) repeat protein
MKPASEEVQAKYETYQSLYLNDSLNVENIIWYGRFAAYIGSYDQAIEIFSKGITLYPDDDRLYRHRGHRYITIRKIDEAIVDLQKAATLIKGQTNELEPDGMPNAQNIPVSTRHGNIWYHLGLAYYLNQDMPNALKAYEICLNTTANDDNVVSASHWLYMISRRMGNESAATEYLIPVKENMNVIENQSYHDICRFYKGDISEEELLNSSDSASSNDAILYAIANWYYYNGQIEAAKERIKSILERDSWNSFGYIAAESDQFRLQL